MAKSKKRSRRSGRSAMQAKRVAAEAKRNDRGLTISSQNLDTAGSPTGRAQRLQKLVQDLKANKDARRREGSNLRARQAEATAQFISTEIDLALTFCEMASSSRDEENARRRIDRATEAYESAAHFLKRMKNSPAVKDGIVEKIEELKHAIERCKQAHSANVDRSMPAAP